MLKFDPSTSCPKDMLPNLPGKQGNSELGLCERTEMFVNLLSQESVRFSDVDDVAVSTITFVFVHER